MMLQPSRNMPFTAQPGLLGKFLVDLRDTAVSWLFTAVSSDAEIVDITGHGLITVRAILDKHYFVRNEALAKSGGIKPDAYLAASLIKWA